MNKDVEKEVRSILKCKRGNGLVQNLVEYIEKNYLRRHEILAYSEASAQRRVRLLLDSPDKIVEHVLRHFHMDMDQVSSKSRRRELVYVRHVCMYLLCKYTKLSLKKIGRSFGGRDHTTVIHAAHAIQDQMDTDPVVRSEVIRLIREIRLTVISRKEKDNPNT